MTLYEWFIGTVSADVVIQALGLMALAVLFATDRIMTKGQHARRVADLIAYYEQRLVDKATHHDREDAIRGERYDDLKESRDGYREATRVERSRADKATDGLIELAELAKTTNALLAAFDDTAKGQRE